MNSKKRIPFLYLHDTEIKINKDVLEIVMSDNKKTSINPSLYSSIIVSGTTHIDQKIVSFISKNKCLLIFSGKNTMPIIMSPISFRQSPMGLRQIKYFKNKRKTENIKRKFIKIRNKRFKKLKLSEIRNDGNLLINEAQATKNAYNVLSRRHGAVWVSKEYANKTYHPIIQINKLLYALSTVAILQLGLNPNLGIVHDNRGGGLVFDIADIFKPEYSWDFSFREGSNKGSVLYKSIDLLNEKMIIKEMISVLEDIFR